MIPYDGRVMSDMINQMGGLGLKRNAEEEWESAELKRRKVATYDSMKSPVIVTYVANLRKTKAKMRRNVKRKKLEDKENFPMEVADQIAEMEMLESRPSVGSGFTFSAESGRRKKYVDKANWVKHDDFPRIVKEGWKEDGGVMENKVVELVRRLDSCRKKLLRWSKQEFPNFKIDQLKHQLSICNEGYLTADKMKEAGELVRQIELAWDKEEAYWWQRNVFNSEGPRPLEHALDYVKEVVTAEDNGQLMRQPSTFTSKSLPPSISEENEEAVEPPPSLLVEDFVVATTL
ncbi:hypothetical protein K1719_035934 [Acacia pycnantha]|nr:hypothetical protein K1719_035934 [Acacia pycnantha]